MRITRLAGLIIAVVLVTLTATSAGTAMAAKGGKNAGCATIQDGTLTYSAGHYLNGVPIPTGFDAYGYNYQAHLFNGSYANAYLGRYGFPAYDGDDDAYLGDNPDAENTWVWPYRADQLAMKWDDAWLSNKDCDGDGLLDRSTPYIGSGAWLTNHQSGSYEDEDGNVQHWNYFVKIVAAPEDASKVGGVWFSADGTDIGPAIWGAFATIQSVYNDTGSGDHGIEYLSPSGPGLGKW